VPHIGELAGRGCVLLAAAAVKNRHPRRRASRRCRNPSGAHAWERAQDSGQAMTTRPLGAALPRAGSRVT